METDLRRPPQLSDTELIDRVKELARLERFTTAELVLHLTELDERELYLGEGCSSLFTYCRNVLRLSESAAYRRIRAARAVRDFPMLLDRLKEGSLHLTAVVQLAPVLTPENQERLILSARYKTKEELETILAGAEPGRDPLAPAPRSSIRRRPGTPLGTATETNSDAGGSEIDLLSWCEENPEPPEEPEAAFLPDFPVCPCAIEAPVPGAVYDVRFTAGPETYLKLRQCQELLKHQIPDGDPARVLDRALTVLLDKLIKQKLGKGGRSRRAEAKEESQAPSPLSTLPGSAGGSPAAENHGVAIHKAGPETAVRAVAKKTRHIPTALRREVWARDGGRCAFVSADGRRCEERGRLEFHHVEPFALGGTATAENIQLRCRSHNAYEGRLIFGDRPGPNGTRDEPG
jgi:hypothetical protein